MKSLEDRILKLENKEAIRDLKHEIYCYCVDLIVAGVDKKQLILDHLTEKVVADFTGFPLIDGKAAVAEFLFETVPSILSYSQHRVSNSVIKVRGKAASALWYVDCPVVFKSENKLVFAFINADFCDQGGMFQAFFLDLRYSLYFPIAAFLQDRYTVFSIWVIFES